MGGLVDAVFGGGPEAPPAPDMQALMQQQAQMNRINQTTPFGSLSFSGPNNATANLELSPEVQQLVNTLQGNAQGMADQLPTGAFNPDIPSVGGTEAGSLGPFDQSTQAQQAVFGRARSLLEPQFERQEERLRQTLANQGLPAGGEAFGSEFGQFNRDRNRAFEEAAFRAVGAGNQRQNQLFQQGLSSLGAQQGVRNQNLGELGNLIGMSQGAAPQLGSFFGPSPVDVTGPAQLQQQGQLAGFNAANQRQNAMLGGLSSLGAAAIFASDRRLKRFIHRIGEVAGLPLYVFQYIWGGGWQVGHMADEVEKVYPDAVIRNRDGYMMVDYAQVWG